MLIKNSWKILVNNLVVVFKAMLYRLIVGVISVAIIYGIFAETISKVLESNAFKNFTETLSEFWHQFISGNMSAKVDLKAPFIAVMDGIRNYAPNILLTVIIAILVLFAAAFLKNVCSFVISTMIHEKTTKMQTVGFMQTLFETLKKSLGFEAIYTLLELFAIIVAIALGTVIIVFTSDFLFVLSSVIGIWVGIFVITTFMTLTATFRPHVVCGGTIKEMWKRKISAKNFWVIFGSMLFALVISVYFNVSMFVMTFASGIVVSLPLTTVFSIIMQLVLKYSLDDDKYFIDYDHVIVPKKLKEDADSATFLHDIDI